MGLMSMIRLRKVDTYLPWICAESQQHGGYLTLYTLMDDCDDVAIEPAESRAIHGGSKLKRETGCCWGGRRDQARNIAICCLCLYRECQNQCYIMQSCALAYHEISKQANIALRVTVGAVTLSFITCKQFVVLYTGFCWLLKAPWSLSATIPRHPVHCGMIIFLWPRDHPAPCKLWNLHLPAALNSRGYGINRSSSWLSVDIPPGPTW